MVLSPLTSIHAQSTPTSDYVEGVPFDKVAGQTLAADLYVPKTPGLHPAIVFIHGGAWKSGDRKQLRGQAALMAENGYFGMAIDYRLAPQTRFPGDLDDCKMAVRWLRQNAAKYNIDPDRIAAVGSSAGAHLASMLGVDSTPLPPGKHRDAKDASVSAVVAFNGIFDLGTMPVSQKTVDLLGTSCALDKKRCDQASPQQLVKPGDPPFFLLHGTADDTAPFSQAENFQKVLHAANVPVEFFTAPGGPHTFWAQAKWKDPSFTAMKIFLLKVMPVAGN